MSTPRVAAPSLHPRAACLFLLADPGWRATLVRAGWTFLVPCVGWFLVLGFRRATADRLAHGPDELPRWSGNHRAFLVDGLKSAGVITTYLAPLAVVVLALAAARGSSPADVSPWIPLALVGAPFLMTVALPVTIVTLAARGVLGVTEAAGLLLAFASVTAVIPAAFLRVSQTGSYRAAFDLPAVARWLVRHGRSYARAWWCSVPLAIVGHAPTPFAPWTIVWCYGAILFAFNEVLVHTSDHGRHGWLRRALADPRWQARVTGTRTTLDGAGDPVRVIDIRIASVPWPLPIRGSRRLGRPEPLG